MLYFENLVCKLSSAGIMERQTMQLVPIPTTKERICFVFFSLGVLGGQMVPWEGKITAKAYENVHVHPYLTVL